MRTRKVKWQGQGAFSGRHHTGTIVVDSSGRVVSATMPKPKKVQPTTGSFANPLFPWNKGK